jgi:glyoxylase-like metal-dependent hydrolase (beta-lactamase superfamily II)
VTQLKPNVAYDRELDVDLGKRQVRILFLGRGNTAGDTVVYLPGEKILATGDLVDHPVPYFFGGFPVDFEKTLEELAKLDAHTLVPGHGEVLRDKAYIFQVAACLHTVNQEVEREINNGLTLEEVQKALPKTIDVNALRHGFAGDDHEDADFFDESFAGLVKASYGQIKMR